MAPNVSIIVPIYNVEKYIERCAVSLFEQTYPNIEYVFVNDCTIDDSMHILKRVLSRYPLRQNNTIIVNHEKNRGLAAARNTGVTNCKGDFIVHVDSDDFLEYNAIEQLVNRQLKTNSDIVTGKALRHDIDSIKLIPHPYFKSKDEMVLDMMQLTINHTIWRRLIRKSLYDDYHVKAEEGVNCGEDCWVMTQLTYYASSVSFIDEVVYHYDCTRRDSYMRQVKEGLNKKKIKDDIATSKLIIDFFEDKEQVFYDEANAVALKYLNNVLFSCARLKDKPYYYEVLSQMKSFDKKYWGIINWDRSYWRSMTQNFHSCRLLSSMMRLYGQMISKVKI